MTRAEFIDVIRNNVSLNCRLPYTLGNENIERVLEWDAKPYFYRMYYYALWKTFYYIDLISMKRNLSTATKLIQLPQEVESVTWLYQVNYSDMMNLGHMFAHTNLMFGMTSQPYISHLSISDWGVAMATMQAVGDGLAMFSKNTLRHNFNSNTKVLELQTTTRYNIVLEVYARIPEEYLFDDPWFIKYVTGIVMQDFAIEIGFSDTTLAGNVKLNAERIASRGEAYVEEVKNHISELNKTGYFINRTR